MKSAIRLAWRVVATAFVFVALVPLFIVGALLLWPLLRAFVG